MRLDQAIAKRFPAISRRKARTLIAGGRVLVNQRLVQVASREVGEADHVAVVEAQNPVDTLFVHDDWIAVNKPPGLPSQPVRDRHTLSLEEILRVEYGEIYLVHRLDTGASGAILFARTREAAARLSKLFAAREIGKVYLARVDPPVTRELRLDQPLDDKEALSIVRPRGGDLVEIEITTGRMHQIRRHLSAAGHPIAGDRRYGPGRPAERLMLHSWKLSHPAIGEVVAPPPAGFGPL